MFTRTRRFKNSCFYGSRTTAPKENYPKTLKLTLTLNRGTIFLGGNCPDTFSTNLLYNRIILYNRTIKTIGFIYICRCGLRSFWYNRFSSCVKSIGYWLDTAFHDECVIKMKHELKFYLWRAPTLVNFIQIL